MRTPCATKRPSQFTSLLALLKPRLDELNLKYECLAGSTNDRQKRVEHFQADPDCPIFLLSLKAGGTGLNLIAADYVYLLDPWWNPPRLRPPHRR